MTKYPELFAALATPFGPDQVRFKPGGGGKKVAYITARHVMNRLDEVLGPENWQDDYTASEHSVLCRLTIRLPDGQELTKADAGGYAGMADQGDDDKSGYSDSFKRAAVKFGVGRELYGDGVAAFVVPAEAPREALRKDPRPFATLVTDELARRHKEYREEFPGAAPVIDEDGVFHHLKDAAVAAGWMTDPGRCSDGKARRLLSDFYKDEAMYRPMRQELSLFLTATFKAAHEAAALEAAGDGARDDGLVEVEGGELVPAETLEPDAGMNG